MDHKATTVPPQAAHQERSLGKSFFILVFSLIYGVALSQIPGNEFKDYDNYLIYARSSLLIFANNVQGGLVQLCLMSPFGF